MKLICIPFAGGNRYSLLRFKPYLSRQVDFITLELPGRGARMAEPLLTEIEPMVGDLRRQIEPHLAGDYLLYGHSMGAALGNLLLHRLHAEGRRLPDRFFVTGRIAPRRQDYKRQLHQLDDEAFAAELARMGGLPGEALAEKEILRFFLPVIRADIRALELSRYRIRGTYPVPITAIAGAEEPITEQQLHGWAEETSAGLTAMRYPGHHFFIFDNLAPLTGLFNRAAAPAKIALP